MIAVGDHLPDVEVWTMGRSGPKPVRTADVLGKGKVVLFALPGAFTPTCSDYHLPGFVLRADELSAKGVDTIACLSVNDAWVMEAWGRQENVGEALVMLADGNGAFTREIGLEKDELRLRSRDTFRAVCRRDRGRRCHCSVCGTGRRAGRQFGRVGARGVVAGVVRRRKRKRSERRRLPASPRGS